MNDTTSETEIEELQTLARAIRLETLKALTGLGFGHYGGCMSVVETLAVLYGSVMRIDPADPDWPERDDFVLSKGHAGPALYSTLATTPASCATSANVTLPVLRRFLPIDMPNPD